MNTSFSFSIMQCAIVALASLSAGAAQAQSASSGTDLKTNQQINFGAPATGYEDDVGVAQETVLSPGISGSTAGSSSTDLSNDTTVSVDKSPVSQTGYAAMSSAQSEATTVHATTRIGHKPKRLAVPAGGVPSQTSELSANVTTDATVNTAALPLPVGLPIPVVSIQAAAGTDGVHLSDTVGGTPLLPPIDVPGLSSLPGLSGVSDLLTPAVGVVSTVTGALSGVAGSGNPLAPVSGVVSGLTGALGGAAGSGSPLAPVTGVVSGIGGATGSARGGGSPLAPVTGLVSGLTGALGGVAGKGGAGAPLAGVLGKL